MTCRIDPFLQNKFGSAACRTAARCVFAESTTRESGSHPGVIVVVVIEKPASILQVQLVGPILRFAGNRTIQLDRSKSKLRAILIHKTTHERSVVVSGTIWILNCRTWLRGIWGLGLLRVFGVLKLGFWLNFWILPCFIVLVINIIRRSSERAAVGLQEKKQRTDK